MTIGRECPPEFLSAFHCFSYDFPELFPGFPPAFPLAVRNMCRRFVTSPCAISRQVAPISHIILSVCVARIFPFSNQQPPPSPRPFPQPRLSRRTSSFNIKRIYETFSFHFDNEPERRRTGSWMANENFAPLMKFSLNRICDASRTATATAPTHG